MAVVENPDLGQPPRKRSLLKLLADIPTLVRELIAGEIELLKQEMIRKLKALGVGIGLLFATFIIVLGMLGVLLTAGIFGLIEAGLPGWLASLFVAAGLLIVAIILGLVGYSVLKKGIPPVPTQTIDGLKKDLNVVRGVGKRETL